jgi:hypothetical protein
MPLCPELQAGRERKGLDEDYTRFVRSFERFPNLVVLDGRRSGYDNPVFTDACHLDPQGAAVFSEGVAEILRANDRASERRTWIAMPTYRERPVNDPFESIGQSALALEPRKGVRR